MSHEKWDELAAGHALDALEPEEEADFVRHLSGCDLCARTLTEMRATAAHLAYAVEPADLPESLGASIMDAVRSSDRPPLPAPAVRPIGAGRGVARRRLARVPASRFLSAAAVLALLVLGMWNASLRGEVQRQQQALDLRRQAEDLLATPGAQVVSLGASGSARGAAVVHDRRVMLFVVGLTPNEGRQAYVLWAQDRAGALHAVEKFSVVNAGRPNVIPEMMLPMGSTAVAGFAVSQELLDADDDLPRAPSGAPVLQGMLA